MATGYVTIITRNRGKGDSDLDDNWENSHHNPNYDPDRVTIEGELDLVTIAECANLPCEGEWSLKFEEEGTRPYHLTDPNTGKLVLLPHDPSPLKWETSEGGAYDKHSYELLMADTDEDGSVIPPPDGWTGGRPRFPQWLLDSSAREGYDAFTRVWISYGEMKHMGCCQCGTDHGVTQERKLKLNHTHKPERTLFLEGSTKYGSASTKDEFDLETDKGWLLNQIRDVTEHIDCEETVNTTITERGGLQL
tara:strand:- start:1066 stop:1812 length:747 start_codon:yes stop_codon:yes gene_type:complete